MRIANSCENFERGSAKGSTEAVAANGKEQISRPVFVQVARSTAAPGQSAGERTRNAVVTESAAGL